MLDAELGARELGLADVLLRLAAARLRDRYGDVLAGGVLLGEGAEVERIEREIVADDPRLDGGKENESILYGMQRIPDSLLVNHLLGRTVEDQNGCLIWQGAQCGPGYRERNGYANVRRGGSRTGHRLMWAALNGPIPEGKVIMHTCDRPPCLNPDHLRLGTQSENMKDAVRKQRCHPNGGWNRRAKRTCDAKGCGLPIKGRGFCGTHYSAHMHRLRNPDSLPFGRKHYTCTEDGCDSKHLARGLCGKHYQRKHR